MFSINGIQINLNFPLQFIFMDGIINFLLICILHVSLSLSSVNIQYDTKGLELEQRPLGMLKAKITNFNVIYERYKNTNSLNELYLILKDTSDKFLGPTFYEDDPMVKFQLKVIERFRNLALNQELQKQQLEELKAAKDVRMIFVYSYIMACARHEEIVSIFKSVFFIQPWWFRNSIKHFEEKINSQIDRVETRDETEFMVDIVEKLIKNMANPERGIIQKIETWRQRLDAISNDLNQRDTEDVEPFVGEVKGEDNGTIVQFSQQSNAEISPNSALSKVSKGKNLRRRKRIINVVEREEIGVVMRGFLYLFSFAFAIIYNSYRYLRQ